MNRTNHLRGARIYLSGPMDFVASRAEEKTTGWRNRVGDFLRSFDSIVFDPWFKPAVRGLHQYGLEDINTIDVRDNWTFAPGQDGDETRSGCAENFWETLHIDLRMVTRAISRSRMFRLTFTASAPRTKSSSRGNRRSQFYR